ncbi:MAG: phenylacetate--CoA ligase family protein [Bacteroidales bacterium]|nr:phenylacetate--CoA ligase family protein [Bacteroidales bacterium]
MTRLSILISDILKGQNTLKYLRHFESFRDAPREKIEAYQLERLKELLTHCEQNTPFYRKRFRECGFSAGDFSSVEQMKLIPPLTRQDLQEHWQEIIASNYKDKKLYTGSSGGSTGQPVSYRKDRNATSAGQAAHLLGWSLSGWKMSMKGLHIWGNPATVNEEWGRLSSKLKAKIFRHHKFPAYRLHDSHRLNELYQLIKKEKYDYLDGYTNAIYHFAEYLKAGGLSFDHEIKYVLTTAENLHDFQRKTIEETIAPVYDTYGCSEINSIAYECSRCRRYHIIDPHVCVEFGKPLDSFGTSPLMITDLDNFAFPLVRYLNGDLGIPAGAVAGECDLNFSVMTAVSGRETDLIKLKDGGVLSVPSFFGSMLLRKVNGLIQYQVEKVSEDMLHINLVTNERFTPDDLRTIESALNEYINGRIGYTIRFVDAIDVSGSGKFKLVIDRTGL